MICEEDKRDRVYVANDEVVVLLMGRRIRTCYVSDCKITLEIELFPKNKIIEITAPYRDGELLVVEVGG